MVLDQADYYARVNNLHTNGLYVTLSRNSMAKRFLIVVPTQVSHFVIKGIRRIAGCRSRCPWKTVYFIDSLKYITLQPSEILISFEICSLLFSVPSSKTSEYRRELLQNNSLNIHELNGFVSLTYKCMTQNCFCIEKQFSKQKDGKVLGNHSSPFTAYFSIQDFQNSNWLLK